MLRPLRRIAVAFVGGTVVAVGVVMLVLPGPAVLVIPAGLAILSTEFRWAGRLLERVRGLNVLRRRGAKTPGDPPAAPMSRLNAS
jgi:tellurite resistance protein TerC